MAALIAQSENSQAGKLPGGSENTDTLQTQETQVFVRRLYDFSFELCSTFGY